MQFNYSLSGLIILIGMFFARVIFQGEEAIYITLAAALLVVPIMLISDIVAYFNEAKHQKPQKHH